jgi:outer membrane protein OmpA-like peptidoglycan-associated protein
MRAGRVSRALNSSSALAVLLGTPLAGHAEPYQAGAWVGPRIFSDDSALGYIPDATEHPALGPSLILGVRLARPLTPHLVPEVELPISVARTQSYDATVLWMNPRAHLRVELTPRAARFRPFLVAGGGAPIALSSKRKTFASDIVGDGYLGVGVHILTARGFHLRADVRISVGPGANHAVTSEFEADFGAWIRFGGGPARLPGKGERERDASADPDDDRIVGTADHCPERPEDEDGFEDSDGCPDIDNDLDQVLDIADRCVSVGETTNGFEDDDGCPDVPPAELTAITGTISGLSYDADEAAVNAGAQSSLRAIATILTTHPSVRVSLVGHSDEQEAATGAEAAPERDLGRERAEAVRDELLGLGIPVARVEVDSRGASEPAQPGDGARARRANRRVELTLVVPQR